MVFVIARIVPCQMDVFREPVLFHAALPRTLTTFHFFHLHGNSSPHPKDTEGCLFIQNNPHFQISTHLIRSSNTRLSFWQRTKTKTKTKIITLT